MLGLGKDKKTISAQKTQSQGRIKKQWPISWWKMLAGSGLVLIGVLFMIIYLNDYHNMMAGGIAVFTLGPGIMLLYFSFQSIGEAGYLYDGKRKITGKENAIILLADRNGNGKDIPRKIVFAEVKKIPKGARMHYVRNLKKHFYELKNNTETRKLEPVILPDKKSFPPELFRIPACMQAYKDAVDYSPPTMLQKIAPGILIGAMGVVGLLMVMTGG